MINLIYIFGIPRGVFTTCEVNFGVEKRKKVRSDKETGGSCWRQVFFIRLMPDTFAAPVQAVQYLRYVLNHMIEGAGSGCHVMTSLKLLTADLSPKYFPRFPSVR